jgi:hypothetical protein
MTAATTRPMAPAILAALPNWATEADDAAGTDEQAEDQRDDAIAVGPGRRDRADKRRYRGAQGRRAPTTSRAHAPGAAAVGLQYVRGGSALATTTLLPASALDRAADGPGALLWDVETLEPIGSPMPLGLDGTAQIARDEEGARMVTGSTSGRAVVWDLDVDHWEDAACRLAGRNLTRDEWARYLPTQPYRETCPQQA